MTRYKSRRSAVEAQVKDHISALPFELVEEIASYLSAEDLLSYRLASPLFAACTDRPFADKFIATRAFLLFNKRSMSQLARMTIDFTKGKHIECIKISDGKLKSKEDNLAYQRSIASSREARLAKKQRIALHAQLLDEQQLDRTVIRLRFILQSMQQQGNNVGIICPEPHLKGDFHPPEDAPPWGYDHLYDSLGYPDCIEKVENDHEAFTAVMKAMHLENHCPTRLELGDCSNGVPITLLGTYLPRVLEHNASAFQNLVTLRLSLTLGTLSDCNDRLWNLRKADYMQDLGSFNNWLFQALLDTEQLQTLGLQILPGARNHETLGRTTFMSLTRHLAKNPSRIPAPKLRTLELERFDVHPKAFVSFVGDRRETMRSVELRNIEHQPSGQAGDVKAISAGFLTLFRDLLPECVITGVNVWNGKPFTPGCLHDPCA